MDSPEFDKFADEYSALHASNIGISGERPEYFAEYKIKDLAAEYRSRHRAVPAAPAVLDFGAGVGTSVPFLREHLRGARLTCLDVSARSLELGRARFSDRARFLHFDGRHVPLDSCSQDIVFAACVFHHIAHDEHDALLREFRRVLVPGGMAMVFEHNPYNPLTVRAVNSCPFDENARLISARAMCLRFSQAGLSNPKLRYRVFFPRMLRRLRALERWMTWLPLGAQYYVVAVK